MYIEAVPNRKSPPAILLRESYRHQGKVKKRTLANLSKWDPDRVAGLRILLKKGTAVANLEASLDIVRSQPHGHIATLVGSLRKIGLDRCLGPPGPQRDLVIALVVARLAHPRSNLATARALQAATRTDSLADVLGLPDLNENHLYDAMDWLLKRQDAVQKRLARRHLKEGSLVLYDLTSCYLEGRRCKLAKRGYSRDGKRGKLQIEFGLICNRDGCPVAVQVFEGNTSDPATVGPVLETLKNRFGLSRVVLVGDRGMLTQARIREEVQPSGLDWITALRAPAIRQLVESGSVQMSLFDERDLLEIRSDAYPDERLMVCRNPLLARQRAVKRQELLAKTEELLEPIAASTRRERRPYRGRDRIAIRVGKVVNKYKMAKHFDLDISDESFAYRRKQESITAEAALDGLYVVRTSLPAEEMDAEATVRAYKGLSVVEQAFRSYKTVDLKVRPIYHWTNDRVRAHVFLCLLAYYVEWHMRQRLAPLLFDDQDPNGAPRPSVVAPAKVSQAARKKAQSKRTPDGLPVHSFRTLLEDLATIVRNQVVPKLPGARPFTIVTRPTPLQQQALDRLGVRL